MTRASCAVNSVTACAVWVVVVLHCIFVNLGRYRVTRGWLCGEPSNSPVVCVLGGGGQFLHSCLLGEALWVLVALGFGI